MKKIILSFMVLFSILPGCSKKEILKEITKEEALEICSKVNDNINEKMELIKKDELSFVVYYKSDTVFRDKSKKISIKKAKTQVSLNHITNEISMFDKKKHPDKADSLTPVKKYYKYNEKNDYVDYYMVYDNFFEFDRTHKKFDNGEVEWNKCLISVANHYHTYSNYLNDIFDINNNSFISNLSYSFYSNDEGELYIECYNNNDSNRRYEIYIKDYVVVSYKYLSYYKEIKKDLCTSIDIKFNADIDRVIPIA